MARELSRVQCGHFRTQVRVVQALSKLIDPGTTGPVTLLDCCCGTGAAVAELKRAWNAPHVKTLGIEIDAGRALEAEKNLDEVLHASIEDSKPSTGASAVLGNLPYDTVRGEGRLEEILFEHVKTWTMRGGLLVLIVPESLLEYRWSFTQQIERCYDVLAVFKYPEPERSEFHQAVLVGRRRPKDLDAWDVIPTGWQENDWPTLPLHGPSRWTLKPSGPVTLRRIEVPDELLSQTIAKSPLRFALLREAMAPEPGLARPVLPLRPGHVAMLLASGLDNLTITLPDGSKARVKGSLVKTRRKVAEETKEDADGEAVATVDRYRDVFDLRVKTLESNGQISNFNSEPPQDAVLNTETEGEEDGEEG